MDKLILFTSSFPFGNKETYLETEIDFLSKAYERIEIYPHYYNQGNKTQREVPNNVKVHKAALPNKKSKILLQLLKGLFKGAKIGLFFKEFFSKKIYGSKVNFKSWLITMIYYVATVGSNQYNVIKREENAVFYFYWGFGWSYMILNFNQSKSCTSYIRLHGSEVYLERSNGYIPLRTKLFQKTDFLLPISNNLASYLKCRYKVLSEKIEVSRLGVFIPKYIEVKKSLVTDEMHLVSCSNVIKLKRIDMIVESLKSFEGTSVKWVHFGDGPEMKAIKEQVEKCDFKTIKIELVGRKTNVQVLEYYKINSVDVFVNVSKHEGIPVSAMEAMSCKIPCIATNVGATAELVNNENGILLEEDFSVDKLVLSLQKVRKVDQWNKKRHIAFAHCARYFNAERNYNKLCKTLK